jgi:hypothetical protein
MHMVEAVFAIFLVKPVYLSIYLCTSFDGFSNQNYTNLISLCFGTIYDRLVQFVTKWYNLWQTGTTCGKLVQFVAKWYNL